MVIVINKNPEDGSKNLLIYETINDGGIMEAEIELRAYHNMITSNRTPVPHIKISGLGLGVRVRLGLGLGLGLG